MGGEGNNGRGGMRRNPRKTGKVEPTLPVPAAGTTQTRSSYPCLTQRHSSHSSPMQTLPTVPAEGRTSFTQTQYISLKHTPAATPVALAYPNTLQPLQPHPHPRTCASSEGRSSSTPGRMRPALTAWRRSSTYRTCIITHTHTHGSSWGLFTLFSCPCSTLTESGLLLPLSICPEHGRIGVLIALGNLA